MNMSTAGQRSPNIVTFMLLKRIRQSLRPFVTFHNISRHFIMDRTFSALRLVSLNPRLCVIHIRSLPSLSQVKILSS